MSTDAKATSHPNANQPRTGEPYPSIIISGGSTAAGPKWTAPTSPAPPPETRAQKPGPTRPAR